MRGDLETENRDESCGGTEEQRSQTRCGAVSILGYIAWEVPRR